MRNNVNPKRKWQDKGAWRAPAFKLFGWLGEWWTCQQEMESFKWSNTTLYSSWWAYQECFSLPQQMKSCSNELVYKWWRKNAKRLRKHGRGRCLWLCSGMPKYSYKALMWLNTNVFQFLFPKIYFSSEQSLEDFYWQGCRKGPEVKESYLEPFLSPFPKQLMWNGTYVK